MNRYIKYIVTFVLAIGAFACTKQDNEKLLADQESSIDKYIQGMDGYRVERLNGSNRIVMVEGSQDTLAAVGDSVYFIYAGYIFSGRKGELFTTNSKDIAEKNNFVVPENIDTICGKTAGDPSLIPGLANGLVGVGIKEECQIVFSAKEGYYDNPIYNVPEMSALLFEIQVIDVVKQKQDK